LASRCSIICTARAYEHACAGHGKHPKIDAEQAVFKTPEVSGTSKGVVFEQLAKTS
jgi:hypothetical protein